ncbi:putative sulfate/molybdate transporter, partial [Myxococcota bacterium]
MTLVSPLNIGAILVCAGLMNILTGLLFKQPIPVQPMKAIAAIVITESLLPDELVAAGLLMGVLMVTLALSGAIDLINRWVPKAVVRGIQLGVGLKLTAKGAAWIGELPFVGSDSILLAVVAVI